MTGDSSTRHKSHRHVEELFMFNKYHTETSGTGIGTAVGSETNKPNSL